MLAFVAAFRPEVNFSYAKFMLPLVMGGSFIACLLYCFLNSFQLALRKFLRGMSVNIVGEISCGIWMSDDRC